MEFSRQEYWGGLPFPSPGDLPNPGIEPGSPTSRAALYGISHQIIYIYIYIYKILICLIYLHFLRYTNWHYDIYIHIYIYTHTHCETINTLKCINISISSHNYHFCADLTFKISLNKFQVDTHHVDIRSPELVPLDQHFLIFPSTTPAITILLSVSSSLMGLDSTCKSIVIIVLCSVVSSSLWLHGL